MEEPDALRPATPGLPALLVALQFGLIGLLAWLAVGGLSAGRLPPDVPVLAGAALVLGLWALSANRPGNFNIRPLHKAGSLLVQHGPYRWLRHPMYSAVLLAGLAAARLAGQAWAWAALLALLAVLAAKAVLEERGLRASHTDYADYCRRTRRFIPGLY